MSNDLLNFFSTVYENDSNCVLIFDRSHTLIWHNDKPFPFKIDSELPALLEFPEEGFPPSGDYTFFWKNALYEYHLTAMNEGYCIVSCSGKSILHKITANRNQRKIITNQIALQHQETFGIRNAVAKLYDLISESDCEELLQDALYDCLNIISVNCVRLLKDPYTQNELLRYGDAENAFDECCNCAVVLEKFAKQCRIILGKRDTGIRILLHADPDMTVAAPENRLEFCLICLLLILCGTEHGCRMIKIHAEEIGGYAVIRLSMNETGEEDDASHLLSSFEPLHEVSEFEAEWLILQLFCQKYGAKVMEQAFSRNSDRALFLRIPLADISMGMQLHTSIAHAERDDDLFYQAMLSNLAEMRFY